MAILSSKAKEGLHCTERTIKFYGSSQSPTSLTPQSNGNDVGDGNGSNGYSNRGGGQAMATMLMAPATIRTMATAMRWRVTKRVMVRAARAMAIATRVAGNKESDGKGSKSNGDGDKEGNGDGWRGQW
jgi:hypothetical protein